MRPPLYGLPRDIQTLMLAHIGPIFVAGMQTTFLATAAGNFECASLGKEELPG
jgi:hypothetical protein